MKHVGTFVALAGLALSLVGGCASPNDDEETGSTDEAALSSRPVTANECRAWQNEYPVSKQETLSTGDVVPVPLRACDMNVAAVFGTIDLSFAQQVFAGTGYVPLEVVRPGKPNAGMVRLYFIDYLTADLQPYREFVVLVDGAEATATADAKKLTYVNSLSTLLPAFDPQSRTYFHQLILNKEATAAIAYGRELLGADKRGGAVDFSYGANDSFDVSVADEHGAPVLHTSLRPSWNLLTLAGTVGKFLGAAVGERIMPKDFKVKLQLLQLNQPMGASGETIGRTPETNNEIVRTRTDFVYLPSINEATSKTMDLSLDSSSALGKSLSDAHFTPAAFITAKHASGAWTIH
jgi:hypothetical protein